jgi:2-dehydro-3-deoxyphosphogluconate aldolase / (4S)-4-hydroxy-2-oxoglutarate aldolase
MGGGAAGGEGLAEGSARLLAMLEQAVIPVLRIDDPKDAVPLARALARGGLRLIEVTLRTPAALECIRRIAAEAEEAIVGAGTVLDAKQFEGAAGAGARFVVSPGLTPALLDAARDGAVPFLPGAATPSEAMAAREAGLRFLKFFPAEQSGGAAFLGALASPLPDLRFCPTGGIGLANAASYLRLANVACVGGSWVAPDGLVRGGQWGRIEELAREAAALTGG